MRKLNEIKELINKICDMTISEEELSDLMIASDEKQELVNLSFAAFCTNKS